jgi:hypothetical protein
MFSKKTGFKARSKSEQEASWITYLLISIPTPSIIFQFAQVGNGRSFPLQHKRKSQFLKQVAIALSNN